MDNLSSKVPGLEVFVFDLDYTLWPFWVDTHVTPPFKLKNEKVYDRHNILVKYFTEVPEVLEKLQSLGYKIAIASRTTATEDAEELLRLFDWNKYISYKEIYPGRKITHINRIANDSGHKLEEMLFFDDEDRNIVDLTGINVCSILVNDGVNFEVIRNGIEKFSKLRNVSH